MNVFIYVLFLYYVCVHCLQVCMYVLMYVTDDTCQQDLYCIYVCMYVCMYDTITQSL